MNYKYWTLVKLDNGLLVSQGHRHGVLVKYTGRNYVAVSVDEAVDGQCELAVTDVAMLLGVSKQNTVARCCCWSCCT